MMIIYNILYFFAFILYLPVLAVRGKLHYGFIQRLGYLGPEIVYRLIQKSNIWFHAVSVGEILAIVPLVEKIRLEHSDRQMVISTVTKTGYALAQKRFPKEDVIIYAPLDFPWSVHAFVKAIKPEMFVVAETEIWPNLLNSCAAGDVPMVMVNGRISDKSFYQYQRLAYLFKGILKRFRGFCMQSSKDADRIIAMGALPRTVTVVGSMKFDDCKLSEEVKRSQLGLGEDAIILVAGSTHSGEEAVVFDVFKKLRIKFPSLMLILAPRHIERSDEVCTLVAANGYTSRRYSQISASPFPGEVIVVDTIGHLKALYGVADIVFVGKSLIGSGGQNIIEPAFFSKPIVVGPHMQNFADIVEAFLADRAIVQIQDVSELEDALYRLCLSAEARHSLGRRARMTITKNQGATAKTLKIISRILSEVPFHRPR